tara:strand:+ start:3571 stop:5256 length:1686 start_codon:yes stop_codon:yes gene_type:complete
MEKIWLKNYPKEVPAEIDINKFDSLYELIKSSCNKYSDKKAYWNFGETLSFAEIFDKSKDLAAYFQTVMGLSKGDKIAIMMPNCLQYPAVLFAALSAGLVVVNVNPLYTARELKLQLIDSEASAIVVLENFAKTLESVAHETNVKHIVVTKLGDMVSGLKGTLLNFAVKYIKRMVPSWKLNHVIDFNKALKIGKTLTFKEVPLNHDDLAFLQYTGGTTGVSKGAMLTHGNMVANILQAYSWIQYDLQEGKEIVITALPLYHIFSLTANCLTFLLLGGYNILITNPKDIPGFVKILNKFKFTVFTGVNTLFMALMQNEKFKKLDFSHFKCTLGGGMAVQKRVADDWYAITKVPLLEAYGLTETSPAVCINPMYTKEYNGTIGLPISSTEVVIMDEDHNILAQGETGEIAVRGPQVMKGYWNNQSETDKALTEDGWFLTGDIGVMDQKGFVKIVDRKKDMILVSGFNVYPNEIEDIVVSHKHVLEAAVIGVPDNRSGEIIKLYVVKKNPDLTKEDLIKHCRDNLTRYKIPKIIEFKDDLPKTNIGKILRRALKEEHALNNKNN